MNRYTMAILFMFIVIFGQIPTLLASKADWNYKTDKAVYSVDISSEGDYIVCGSLDNNFYFLSKEGDLLWKYPSNDRALCVDLTPDGYYIVGFKRQKSVYVF